VFLRARAPLISDPKYLSAFWEVVLALCRQSTFCSLPHYPLALPPQNDDNSSKFVHGMHLSVDSAIKPNTTFLVLF
jgi:hypothetical protein